MIINDSTGLGAMTSKFGSQKQDAISIFILVGCVFFQLSSYEAKNALVGHNGVVAIRSDPGLVRQYSP